MPARKQPTTGELKDPMQQKWYVTKFGYKDQYGFEITTYVIKYRLYWRNKYQLSTYTIQAAKEISNILLNDKILAG